MQHVKSLDGIRGIAVCLVMLFHFGYFAAGWIGVQIFFTLSGYLITNILLQDRGAPFSAYIGRFYWRRSLRIFPLFYVFLLVVALLHVISGSPASFPADWAWLMSYTANFARMREGDLGPYFVHIWSLAVEEQFYLIWPLLIYFLPESGHRRVVGGLLLLSPLIRLALVQALLALGYDVQYAGKVAYALPFTQFDAFAAGAAIPLWGLDRIRHAGRWFVAVLGVCAAAGFGVLAATHFLDRSAFVASLGYALYMVRGYGYVWGYSLLNVLSMLFIVCALQGIGSKNTLENKLLVWIGKISYGVYVYHLPVLLLGELSMDNLGIELQGVVRAAFFVAWIAVVLLVADISFRWLEMPFLKLKNKWGSKGAVEEQRQLAG